MTVSVYGDYAGADETLLHEADTFEAARQWAETYVRKDFGGYMTIDLVDSETGVCGFFHEIDGGSFTPE